MRFHQRNNAIHARSARLLVLAAVLTLFSGTVQATPITFSPVPFPSFGAIVSYVIPTSGIYDITAMGASGGGNSIIGQAANGGIGAEIGGDLFLSAGQTLEIAVGVQGISGFLGGGGGGGGSFVVLVQGSALVPLVVAGGGGGAFYYPQPGQNGQLGTSGGNSSQYCKNGGTGGSNGNGGLSGHCVDGFFAAGGGGGFYTDGGNDPVYGTSVGGQGGKSFLDGLAGGGSPGTGGAGGFGGGGGGSQIDNNSPGSGGGGGGYSGGGGGLTDDIGGGGGSYFTGLPDFSPIELVAKTGTYGNGLVTLDLVQAITSAPEPVTLSLFSAGVAGAAAMRRRKKRSTNSHPT